MLYLCFVEMSLQVLLYRLQSDFTQGQGYSFLYSLSQLQGLQYNGGNLLEECQNLNYIGLQMFFEVCIKQNKRSLELHQNTFLDTGTGD